MSSAPAPSARTGRPSRSPRAARCCGWTPRRMRFVRPSLQGDAGDSLDRVEYSHDGSRLAAATGNGNVLVWDAATGALLHRFVGGGVLGARLLGRRPDGPQRRGPRDVVGPERRARAVLGREGLRRRRTTTVSKPAPDGRTLVRERRGRMWFVDNQTGRETAKRPRQTPDIVPRLVARLALAAELARRGHPPAVGDGHGAAGRAATAHRAVSSRPSARRATRCTSTSSTTSILLVLDASDLKPTRAPIELGTPVLARRAASRRRVGVRLRAGRCGAARRTRHRRRGTPWRPPARSPSPGRWRPTSRPDGTRFLGPNLERPARCSSSTPPPGSGSATAAPRDERFGTFDLSPDGTQFATLDGDRIALFDGTTGARQGTIPLPSGLPSRGSPTSRTAAACWWPALDGTTWTVDTDPDSWVDRACTIAGRNLSREEWKEYFPGRAYEVTCAQWPAGS